MFPLQEAAENEKKYILSDLHDSKLYKRKRQIGYLSRRLFKLLKISQSILSILSVFLPRKSRDLKRHNRVRKATTVRSIIYLETTNYFRPYPSFRGIYFTSRNNGGVVVSTRSRCIQSGWNERRLPLVGC